MCKSMPPSFDLGVIDQIFRKGLSGSEVLWLVKRSIDLLICSINMYIICRVLKEADNIPNIMERILKEKGELINASTNT